METLRSSLERTRADSTVEELMALEATAKVKTVLQLSNQTMVDSDTMRGTISALQAENDQLKEQLANQVFYSTFF